MKQRVRLTESDLHKIVKKSVNRILKEVISKDDKGRLIWEPELNDLGRVEDDDGITRSSEGMAKAANAHKYLKDKGFNPYEME